MRRLKMILPVVAVFLGLGLGLISGIANAEGNKPEDHIRELLLAQNFAWNRGDIEAFMEGYWRDERLTFVSGGTMLHGWEATLKRYQTTYPDRAAMGTLSFEDEEIEFLADDVAMVKGVFRLAREHDNPWGRYTLILRRFTPADAHGEPYWRIVYDHTSSGE